MPEKKNAKREAEEVTRRTGGREAAVIYLGPAIAGVAVPGTVYRNGLTPQMQKAAEELPAIKRLLVETGSAAGVRKELRNPQSAASICYGKIFEYAKKKGAKG